MTQQMEQWMLQEHNHRWNNEIYKRAVIHMTAIEDQEDTLDYDRLYIELLVRLLTIDFEEISMTGETTDELAIERIVQHYQRIDEVLNENNAYTEWLTKQKGNSIKRAKINHNERGELLRKFLLYLPWNTSLKRKDPEEDSDDDGEEESLLDEDPLFLFLISLNDEEMKEEEQCWPDYFKNHQEIHQPNFVGKCGECDSYHKNPRCKHCKRMKTKAGICEHCGEIPDPDEVYIGYCGKCKLQHELPTCVNCRNYKQEPGNCEYCGIPENDTNVEAFLAKTKGELEFRKLVDGIADELTQYYQQFKTTNATAMSDETKVMDLEQEATNFNTKISAMSDIQTTDINRDILERSLCKVLPDGMTIPDDIIPTIGCVWCGSGNHDTVNCQAYLTWTQNCASAQSIDDPSVKLDLMKKTRAQLIEYHDTGKPWEFYVNLDDGEYLTPQGVKLIVRFKRILNLIPRNMQTVSVSYAALPTPLDIANAIKLSSEVRRNEVVTLKEELQHHKEEMHTRIEDLETSVIKSLDTKLLNLYKKFDVDLNQIYTSIMDDRIEVATTTV